MNKKTTYKLGQYSIPAEATHPGEFLKDEMEYRGITPRTLAEKSTIPLKEINNLLQGTKSITYPIANCLENAMGIDAATWMRLQVSYEWDTLRIKHRNEIYLAKKLNATQKEKFLHQVFVHA